MRAITLFDPTKIEMAFVGCVVPDEPSYHSVAFSRAGNMFQTNLINSIEAAGIAVSTVISPVPVQAWPLGRRLLVKRTRYRLGGGVNVDSPAFVNVPLLKQLTIGMAVFCRLLVWGWRRRNRSALVVSTFNLTVPPGLFTLIASRLIGAKVLAHINDVNIPGETVPRSPAFWVDYKLQRWLMPRFDALVVVADAIVRDFGLETRHIRLEGGITESSFMFPPEHISSPTFVIVSAGSLDEPNGFKVLIEAFAKLKGEHYRLRIAGAGPLESEVRYAAEQDPRIEYCGYLSFEDVLRVYASADVLINMRLTRSFNTKYFFPSKVMEYLASGRPVVSTCTGHMEEEFGDFTFLLKQETPEALADMIRDVERLGSEARECKGAKAREYMMTHKTWTAQGRRVARLIKSLFSAGA